MDFEAEAEKVTLRLGLNHPHPCLGLRLTLPLRTRLCARSGRDAQRSAFRSGRAELHSTSTLTIRSRPRGACSDPRLGQARLWQTPQGGVLRLSARLSSMYSAIPLVFTAYLLLLHPRRTRFRREFSSSSYKRYALQESWPRTGQFLYQFGTLSDRAIYLL